MVQAVYPEYFDRNTAIKVRKIVRRARKYVDNPKTWTRDAFARNKEGVSVDADDPSACRFCAAGAIMRSAIADYDLSSFMADNAIKAIDLMIDTSSRFGRIMGLNDASVKEGGGRRAVLKLFDKFLAQPLPKR